MIKNDKTINLELIKKLSRANHAINVLKQELRESKESWMLYMWSLIEEEIQGFKWRTNPPPFVIKATHKSKPVEYRISITDIVCVIGKDRDKFIYLKHSIGNIVGEYHSTNKIEITSNDLTIEELCNKKLDTLMFHLVQVSKSAAINLAYYHYSNPSYTLTENLPKCKEVNKIKASKIYLKNYKDKKMHFDDVISLQRLVSCYKEKMEDKI